MRLILLGAPGAGKGTQGALLADAYGIDRISTGDILRDAVRNDTPLGREARTYMDAGELVPDDVILGMIREVLVDAHRGFVLDGFPRTLEQARALDTLLDDMGLELDAVVVLDVPDEVLVKRISGRRSCPDCGRGYNVHFDPPKTDDACDRCGSTLLQRSDDAEDTVRHRLQVYRRQTEPLIAFYRDSDTPVRTVEGDRPVADVQEDIREAVAA